MVLESVLLLALAATVIFIFALIGKLKTQKAEAERNRERLTLALDGADEALWDWNIAANRTYYDERWSRMLGYSPEEIGNSVEIWERLVHPADFSVAVSKLTDHMEGRTESYQCEFRMRTKDGNWRWIQARGKVVQRAANGSPVRVAGTHLDITSAKHHEKALRREQHLLERVIDVLPHAVYFKDRESRFVKVNSMMAAQFGASEPAELLGKTDFDYFAPEHANAAYADEQDLVTGFKAVVLKEEKEIWRDGRETWVLTTKLPLHDDSGEVFGTFGMSRDITDRKRMEHDLRTAKEAAEAANVAKGQFLANMSHEMRTPLNGVFGITELLLNTPLDPEQRDYAETIRTSAESLTQLINDILDFSKIEANKLDVCEAAYAVRPAIEATARVLALPAYRKGLELRCEIHPSVPEMVVGDEHRLRQVMMNLIGNAVKFTERGHVAIVASASPSLPGEAENRPLWKLQIDVLDTGIGIERDKLERIFEPFEQGDGSITRRFGGTGLGLAISRRLVEMMGGNIWVESRPGQGSVFHFTVAVRGLPNSDSYVDRTKTTQRRSQEVTAVAAVSVR